MKNVATVLIEQDDGELAKATHEFGAFKRGMRSLVEWFVAQKIELVVMESTGIYWKSVYAWLERAGIAAWVVNARHVKTVPGRKTDVTDYLP